MSTPIGSGLSSRDNSLNAVRLILAAAVILAHSWTLGGYDSSTLKWIGDNSVNGFFALSGFLIAGSRLRNGFGHYLWRRAQRIFPGFWVCLVVIGFVFAPIGGLLGGQGWNPVDSVGYVVNNASLVIHTRDIGDTLAAAPEGSNWNRSLWSLMHEFIAYLLCGAALGIAWVRRNLALSAGLVVAVLPIIGWTIGDLDGEAHMINDALRLLPFFAAGVLAYSLKDRIHTSHVLAGLSAVLVLAAGFTSEMVLNTFTAVPLTYLLLHVGSTWRTSIAADEDVSFGLYIYGYPVQQVLGMVGLGFAPVWVFAIISLALTYPLALASWRLVEKPALGLRRPTLPIGSRSTTDAPAPTLQTAPATEPAEVLAHRELVGTR